MHQPRPHGLTALGGELTGDDAAAVELLARRITNLKQLSGVDSMRMVRALPDGGYAIAQDMGGVFRIICHKPEQVQPPEFDGIAVDYVPMLFSGVITKSVLREGEGVGIKLSELTRKRITNYNPEVIAPKSVELQRFRIDYHQLVYELGPLERTEIFYSQYAGQRPTWYSGAMAEIMQIVGGYGRQKFSDLPDTATERARLQIPKTVMDTIKRQMGSNVRLPGYTGLPPADGKFRYDYKFHNTNGVGFDTHNKPWLICVKPGGVWVMPLPLIPATTTAAFRTYVTQKGDDELVAILDRFGGMPSGESFPIIDRDFEAWRRAGIIIKACNTSTFYDHIQYSSACGWSFNSTASEGFNTCYDYIDAEGIGIGYAFKLKLHLHESSMELNRPPILLPPDPQDQSRLNAYLAGIYTALKNDATGLAIKYKLRCVPLDQILGRAVEGMKVTEAEVNYWDNLEVSPIANHSGSVTEVGRGYIYHGASFKYQPQIKFPEPFMGGCVSHDFLPLAEGVIKGPSTKSDTIMFGYYDKDDLKVVKYFRDGGSYQEDIKTDYEECMIVGSWTETVTLTPTAAAGNFYTSDIDERKTMATIEKVTHVVGTDKGYDTQPAFAFDYPFSSTGTLWRSRYFETRTIETNTEGKSLAVAICIPYYNRNAVLHATSEGTTGTSRSEKTTLGSVADPTSYRYWTYDRVYAWRDHLEVQNGKPFPKDGSPVWVEMETYSPAPCSDFADGGSWIGGLPSDYTWLIHPKSNEWMMSGGGGPPSFEAFESITGTAGSTTGNLKLSMTDEVKTIASGQPPSNLYFMGSPDEFVGTFYRDACRVVFGSTVYANVSETDGGHRKYFGHCSLVEHQAAYNFIGVINE